MPALDVVHGLVADQLLDQRSRRIPVDAAQFEKRHIEPGGEQVLQFGVERNQPLVGLEKRQQLGAQVDQEAHALGLYRKALQQPHAGRHQRPTQFQFGLAFVGRSDRRLVVVARRLELLRIGREMLAHQRPVVAALFGRGGCVFECNGMRPPAALDLAHARIDDRLQGREHAAQGTRRERLVGLAQRGLHALGGRARSGLCGSLGRTAGGALRCHGHLAAGLVARTQPRLEPFGRTHRHTPILWDGEMPFLVQVMTSPLISAAARLRAGPRAGGSGACAWRHPRLRCRAP